MKKLILTKDLEKHLEKNYKSFADERGRKVHISNFMTLFYYKYANSLDDIWQFWIKKDCLHCENVSGFQFVFPLKKDI